MPYAFLIKDMVSFYFNIIVLTPFNESSSIVIEVDIWGKSPLLRKTELRMLNC